MGTLATQPQSPEKSFEHSLLMILCGIMLCMIGVKLYKDPLDVSGLLIRIGVFGTAATGLFIFVDRFTKKNKVTQVLKILVYLTLIVLGACQVWTDVQDVMTKKIQDMASIVKTVEDSTKYYAQTRRSEEICKDCNKTGKAIKAFRDKFIDSLLAAKDIHEKDRNAYKLQLDSLLADPVIESCTFAQYHREFERELRLLIALQDIHGVDRLLRKYNISASAKYHLLVEGDDVIVLGTFRNYVVDVINGTQFMFRQIYLPPYSQDKVIEKILLVNS